MSEHIIDSPFVPVISDPHETTFIDTCKNGTQIGMTFFPTNPNCESQLADRAQYLRNITKNQVRATIFPGPYPNYTSTQLDMRRKAEILQYTQNAMIFSKKQNWNRLIATKLINKRVCLIREQTPISSTKSDVPPPRVDLFYDPNVPLYNYKPNPSTYNEFPYPDIQNTSLQSTTHNNVLVVNTNPIFEFTFINPSNNMITYNLTSPLSISLTGTYDNGLTDTTTATSDIQTLDLLITNTGTGALQYTYPISVAPLDSLNMTFTDNGEFNATLYIGALSLSDIEITQCPQYNYTFSLQATLNTIQKNILGNPSTSPFSISNVCYANIENNSTFYETENNCTIDTIPPVYVSPSFE